MHSEFKIVKPYFRSAFLADISSWSSGSVEYTRSTSAQWQDKKATLEDESIFGPSVNYRCMCGKASGQELAGWSCPVCWTPIETNESRKTKFGKILLCQPIDHPFEEFPTDLWAIPVLPAVVREQQAELDSLYDQIVSHRDCPEKVRLFFDDIIGCIWPSFLSKSATNSTKIILGRGMAITPRRQADPGLYLPDWTSRICTNCGATDEMARQSAKSVGMRG